MLQLMLHFFDLLVRVFMRAAQMPRVAPVRVESTFSRVRFETDLIRSQMERRERA